MMFPKRLSQIENTEIHDPPLTPHTCNPHPCMPVAPVEEVEREPPRRNTPPASHAHAFFFLDAGFWLRFRKLGKTTAFLAWRVREALPFAARFL